MRETASRSSFGSQTRENEMAGEKAFRIGILGAALSGVVCFTPLVVVAFGLVGLSSWFPWVDGAFHGILALSLGAVGFAAYRIWRTRKKREASSPG